MKFHQYTRYASLVLAFGFFFACSSSKPSIDSLISNREYENALNQLEEQLQLDANQPDLLIKKGEIHTLIAAERNPIERSVFYEEAINAFNDAKNIGLDSTQASLINSITIKNWSKEHNAGTILYQSEKQDSVISIVKSHFNNAIIISPKRANSYTSLATAYYSSGDISEAINTLNIAKNVLDEVSPKLYENLGFLYLQHGEPEQSVFYYELANTDIIKSKNIAFGLVNAYISTSKNEEAVSLLSNLVDSYPNDATIRNVYGTQLYLIVDGIMSDLNNAYLEADTSLAKQILFEAEGVGEQAEEELIQAFSRDTTNSEFIESLAVFYNNLTGNYLSVYENAFDIDKEKIETKASTLLNFALDYYDKLLELNPNDTSIQSTITSLNKLRTSRFSS